MNLEKRTQSELKQLHTDICALCDEIETTEVTAGNKELIRDSILQRLHSLPLPSSYDEVELQPDDGTTVKAEIDQMAVKLTALKTELESLLKTA